MDEFPGKNRVSRYYPQPLPPFIAPISHFPGCAASYGGAGRTAVVQLAHSNTLLASYYELTFHSPSNLPKNSLVVANCDQVGIKAVEKYLQASIVQEWHRSFSLTMKLIRFSRGNGYIFLAINSSALSYLWPTPFLKPFMDPALELWQRPPQFPWIKKTTSPTIYQASVISRLDSVLKKRSRSSFSNTPNYLFIGASIVRLLRPEAPRSPSARKASLPNHWQKHLDHHSLGPITTDSMLATTIEE